MASSRLGSRPSYRRLWVDGRQVVVGAPSIGTYTLRGRDDQRLTLTRRTDQPGWAVLADHAVLVSRLPSLVAAVRWVQTSHKRHTENA